MPNNIRILSIDGGGLRGVIAVKILQKIEEYITNKSKFAGIPSLRQNISIATKFNLIAGTSTGALISCAMTVPKANTLVNVPKYNLKEIEDIYINNGKDIFPHSIGSKIRKHTALFWPQYSRKGLHQVLTEKLGSSTLTHGVTNLLIPTYDLKTNTPLILTSRKAWDNPSKEVLMSNACLASSAAPSYLKPYAFNYDNKQVLCIDGGVYLNNPSMSALAEVLKHKKHYGNINAEIKNVFVLSISTGRWNQQQTGIGAEHFGGRLNWALPISSIMMSGQSEATTYSTKCALTNDGTVVNFLRINVNLGEKKESDMTASTKEMIDKWVERAEQTTNTHTFKKDIDDFLTHSGII